MATAINVTAGSQAVLTLANTSVLAVPGTAGGLIVPLMQDVTISAAPGSVRYSTLDSSSSSAFTTTNENSVSLNLLVDGDTFFGPAVANTTNEVANVGLLGTSINKTEIFFTVAFNEGNSTGEYYVAGQGFIGGLAPTASLDSAVWLTPMEIIVNGEITSVTL